MYNVTKVINGLTGLIGFREEGNMPAGITLTEELKASSSGLYWQRAHALISLENLYAIAPPFNTELKFQTWLKEKTDDSIIKVLSSVVQKKKLAKNVKSLLDDAYVYEGSANFYDKEVRQSRFVGFQIILKRHQGLVATINEISTQLDTVQDTPLKIYLYHSSSLAPIKTFDLETATSKAIEWHTITEGILSYVSDKTDAGGVWFIGYYEDDLQGQAYNKTNFNYNTGPCVCEPYQYQAFARWFQYLSIIPFIVQPQDLNEERDIWRFERMQYIPADKSFGLNLNISVSCDITPIICRQKQTFQDAILLQFGVDMLHEMGYSTASNRLQEITKTKALFDLDDRENHGGPGLKSVLLKEIDAVELDFSDLNSICLPCTGVNNVIDYTAF